jgi:hypothetical protein
MARPQFSIRTVLLTTALIALALAVLSTPVAWLAGPGLLVLGPGIPAVMLLILLRSSGGYRRAFFVGAIFPACAAEAVMVNEIYGSTTFVDPRATYVGPGLSLEGVDAFLNLLVSYDTRFSVGVCWATIPLTGLLCIAAEWALNRADSRGNLPPS